MGKVVFSKTSIAIALVALVLLSINDTALAVQPDEEEHHLYEEQDSYVPGEVLVLLSADVNKNGMIEDTENFVNIDSVLPGKIHKRFYLKKGRQIFRVKLPKSKSVKTAIKENWKKRDTRILVVEPNYRLHLLTNPDDPYFPHMWQLNNIGQTGGIEDADIDAPEAWDITTGETDVIIAVIDSGIDYMHPDLAENMWINIKEKRGKPGVDDDKNGYIDDVHGYDFYQNDGDPSDAKGHGTHCAGIIAALGNNALGVTGVNWKCQIMACRFLNALGSGNTADAIEAINYAVKNGAKILSNSWGGSPYSASLEAAIAYAYENGVLFVASAGNDNRDNDLIPAYPASYKIPNVIAVAATNHKDQRSLFSNYGRQSVHLGAPGEDILSTVPVYKTIFYENFQDADVPEFDGTLMTKEGPASLWGTIQNDILFRGNIVAHVDWQNSWPYLPDSNGSIVTPPIDTRDARGLTLYFIYRYEIGSSDALTADVWDGTKWHTIFSRNSNCCFLKRSYFYTLVDIPEAYRNEQMKVRFKWLTDASDNNFFGAEIDRIQLRCISESNGDYQRKNGTSMAAPHVAGAAGLLLANNPDICLSQLRNRLITTGDTIEDLNGITISGQRLNLLNAFTEEKNLNLISPNGGQTWITGSTQTITWSSFNCGPVDIYLLKNGSVYRQLANGIDNLWTFTWDIPDDIPEANDYQIMVDDQTQVDISDGTFTIRPPTVFYVDDNADEGGNGRSWNASFNDLQDALNAALARDKIYVAQGTYFPSKLTDPCDPRSATFQLIDGVTVKGGYAGPGVSDPNERNHILYETILSGDLYNNDASDPNQTENCYHVLTAENTNQSAVLDGFTITAANANASNPNNAGAGMYIKNAKTTLVNCKFINNSAQAAGGALINLSNASTIITNCLFSENWAGLLGGAVYSYSSEPNMKNCAFTGNAAGKYGGAIYCYSSFPVLTNCTLGNNFAALDGGGIFNRYQSVLKVDNSILFNNTDSGPVDQSAQIFNENSTAFVNYTCIQGLSGTLSGNNNIDLDPMFIDPNGIDEIPGTIDDNLRLSPVSPCIDAGDPDCIPESPATDLDGETRIWNGRIDMGAYEFIPNRPPIADPGQDQSCYTWFDTPAEVTLDASKSYDPDGDPLTYLWRWTVDSNDYEANTAQPIISLPIGVHTIELIVSDAIFDSEPNYVLIDVIPPMEVELKIHKKTIFYTTRKPGNLVAVITLPKSISQDYLIEQPLLLCPSLSDLCLEAHSQYIQTANNNIVRYKAFFDKSSLAQIINQKGLFELYLIGRLNSGQYIHATDSITIK